MSNGPKRFDSEAERQTFTIRYALEACESVETAIAKQTSEDLATFDPSLDYLATMRAHAARCAREAYYVEETHALCRFVSALGSLEISMITIAADGVNSARARRVRAAVASVRREAQRAAAVCFMGDARNEERERSAKK